MVKSRWWSIIVYPESVKENWKQILQETQLQFAISPLHDKDLHRKTETHEDKELKKPHYHVLIRYPNNTTWNAIKQIISRIGASQDIEKVYDPVAMYEYHIHKNNKEDREYKPLYNDKDRELYNGFEPLNDWEENETSSISQIISLIKTYRIIEYCDIVNILLDISDKSLITYLVQHDNFFKHYIDSNRYKYCGKE